MQGKEGWTRAGHTHVPAVHPRSGIQPVCIGQVTGGNVLVSSSRRPLSYASPRAPAPTRPHPPVSPHYSRRLSTAGAPRRLDCDLYPVIMISRQLLRGTFPCSKPGRKRRNPEHGARMLPARLVGCRHLRAPGQRLRGPRGTARPRRGALYVRRGSKPSLHRILRCPQPPAPNPLLSAALASASPAPSRSQRRCF